MILVAVGLILPTYVSCRAVRILRACTAPSVTKEPPTPITCTKQKRFRAFDPKQNSGEVVFLSRKVVYRTKSLCVVRVCNNLFVTTFQVPIRTFFVYLKVKYKTRAPRIASLKGARGLSDNK